MKIVIRPAYWTFHRERLSYALEKMTYTSYVRGTQDEDAPLETDCVTAVRWLLNASSDFVLPRGYIGDLPKILMEMGCAIYPLHEAACGDLVFFEKMSLTHGKYMVNHMGLMISPEAFIHSSHKYQGSISRIDDREYIHSILDESFLPLARDPRNHQQ